MELSEKLKAKLELAETDEDIIRVCAEEGVEITLEQLEAAKAQHDGELSEDALDDVSGGVGLILAGAAAAAVIYVWKKERERIERENNSRRKRKSF